MRSAVFVWTLLLSQCIALSAQGIWALPGSYDVLTPGTVIEATFVTAEGADSTLPSEGRYLLWVVSSLRAPEVLEPDPESADANLLLAALPQFDALSAPTFILFYDPRYLPLTEEYPAVQELFDAKVLFDDAGAVPATQTRAGFLEDSRVEGLYLMEGQVVQHRYLSLAAVFMPLILDQAQTFLAGETVTGAPVPATRGARLDMLTTDEPAFLLMVSRDGLAMTDDPDTGIPALQPYLMENLPALLAEYDVQAVALTGEPQPEVAALGARYPAWAFHRIATTAEALRWSEFSSAVVLDAGGTIIDVLTLVTDANTTNDGLLIQALRSVE
jgi:hypothetical protein